MPEAYGRPDCWCATNVNYVAPDKQARKEVEANLNHARVDTLATREMEREAERIKVYDFEYQAREAHLILDDYDAPLFDPVTGDLLTVNHRLREVLADLKDRSQMATSDAKLWEGLFRQAILDLRVSEENREIAAQLLDSWQNRALLLEGAVKTYAGHVWNDIKQKLKEQVA